ncbi:Hypothetical predicted protein, partial [Olea europaea subsp. europaea]
MCEMLGECQQGVLCSVQRSPVCRIRLAASVARQQVERNLREPGLPLFEHDVPCCSRINTESVVPNLPVSVRRNRLVDTPQ